MLWSNSILNSQLHSSAVSAINYLFKFHEGAAIPPKKLFGSSLLCIITKVEPKQIKCFSYYTFIITILMKLCEIKTKNYIINNN